MTNAASDPFANWLSSWVRPALRERGYTKAGAVFHRRVSAGWGVVGFQRSQYGSRLRSRFTVNLGVSLDRLAIARGDDPGRKPAEHRCIWRSRIGATMAGAADHWWDIDAETDLAALTAAVVPIVIERGLPLIDERLTEEGFVAALATTPRVGQVVRFTDAQIIDLLGITG